MPKPQLPEGVQFYESRGPAHPSNQTSRRPVNSGMTAKMIAAKAASIQAQRRPRIVPKATDQAANGDEALNVLFPGLPASTAELPDGEYDSYPPVQPSPTPRGVPLKAKVEYTVPEVPEPVAPPTNLLPVSITLKDVWINNQKATISFVLPGKFDPVANGVQIVISM